jgi:hypothetical protein
LLFTPHSRSLKATVLDADLSAVAADVVHFDSELPHYGTDGGVRRDPAERGCIVAPPLMWAEALDLLLGKLAPRADLRRIAAVSGSAQQHGSVYWARGAAALLAALDPAEGLAPQLAGAFAAPESPVWMDSSTTAQCREVEAAMGGAARLAALTGCRAHERCTGPQIRKVHQTRPGVYHATERVSLVSSFMASLLLGAYACIDETDGAGMNLMDISTRQLRNDALQVLCCLLVFLLDFRFPFAFAIAHLSSQNSAGDGSKFRGEDREASTSSCCSWKDISLFCTEVICTMFVLFIKIQDLFMIVFRTRRFQFASSCLVIQWSGDNPNSLAGNQILTNFFHEVLLEPSVWSYLQMA